MCGLMQCAAVIRCLGVTNVAPQYAVPDESSMLEKKGMSLASILQLSTPMLFPPLMMRPD
jgi:hypothetical protein